MSITVKNIILKHSSILIVDDDVDLAANLEDILREEGYQVTVANNGESALSICRDCSINLVIADIKLPDISGVELTRRIGAICPNAEVIIVTGYASIDSAIAAVKLRNVIGYQTKPLDMRNIIALVKQIMERHQAQEAARESEHLYQLLADNVVDVIWTADMKFKMTYVSPSIKQQLGYTQDEALILSLTGIVPPESLDIFRQTIKDWESGTFIRNEERDYYVTESENVRKDGSVIWTESRIRFMPATEERAAYLLGVTRDITQRKKGIEQLRRSQARLAEAEKIAHLGHWDLDLVSNKLVWSDETFRIFGVNQPYSSSTYEDFLSFVHPADRKFVERSVSDALNEGNTYSIDHRIIRPDGNVRHVHEHGEVTFNEKRKPLRMFGTVQDITERVRIEEELRLLSFRLVQIQEEERQNISRELHDQVGQVLTVLKLTLDRAMPSCAQEVRKQLEDGVNNITELISTIRNISLNLRPSMLDDLGLLPTLFWHFDRFTAQTDIKVDFKHHNLERRFPPEITITAYRIIQEALTNVARYSGARSVSVRAWSTPESISVQIEDKGEGFIPEDIDSRKSSGLHGMRERVRLLGGTLSVESTPGAGTIITAELPVPKENKKGKANDHNRNRGRPRRRQTVIKKTAGI
ncbi:MAG: PAS domain S-box protein [Dehalococcoidales bacterium]|nr:PAS domain S-box protein [Dehalococcoidales bacterium]